MELIVIYCRPKGRAIRKKNLSTMTIVSIQISLDPVYGDIGCVE